jgi:hypothetical protein
MDPFDELPNLSAKEAYLAMLEFLRMEFDITGPDKTVHLGGLLAEMDLEPTGDSADPGAVEQFAEAVGRVLKKRI